VGFQVKLQEVNVEFVKNGKNGYEVANVNYLYKGEAKSTKLMSFSNPQIFKDVQKLVGQTVEVETTQNGKYTNWAKLTPVAASPDQQPSVPGKSDVVKSAVARSSYETPEERAQRQLMIVRQSSISNAIEFQKVFNPNPQAVDVEHVLSIAQEFVDFVYSKEELGHSVPLEELDDDIPH